MGDDREMPRLPFFRRGPSFEGSPNRFVVLAAGETPSAGDAGDVRIDGERRMSPAHREDDVRGLRANAGKGHELVPRPVRRKGEDLIEAAGPPVADLLGDGADPGGLLAGEAGMPNRPGDVLLRNAGEAVGRIAAESLAAYPPGVPNVLPGERLSAETLDYVQRALEQGGSLRGASDRRLRTVRVVAE